MVGENQTPPAHRPQFLVGGEAGEPADFIWRHTPHEQMEIVQPDEPAALILVGHTMQAGVQEGMYRGQGEGVVP